MGVVFKAYDPDLDRAVALKLLHSRTDSESRRRRFQREAQAIARLRHANVVTVYDVGEHDGEPYIAMELVRGGTLADWMRAEARSTEDVLHKFRQAAAGLVAAHAEGMVHRDFKPANVLLDDDGTVRVADFGLARIVDSYEGTSSPDPDELASPLADRMTRTGALMGTPAYMAPEQVLRANVDARADQFAFCVSLYEALTGVRPKRRDDQSVSLEFASRRVPAPIQRVLRQGVSFEPDKRFASMTELLDALVPSRRVRWPMALLLAGGVLGGALYGWPQADSGDELLCRDVAAPVGEVWNPRVSAALGESFLASGHPRAEQIVVQLRRNMEERARVLTEGHVAACMASARGGQSPEMLDRRMLCYRRQLRRVDKIIAAWTGDPTVDIVDAAANQLERLVDDQECSAEALMEGTPLPDTPGARRVLELIDETEVLIALGREAQAEEEAQRAVEAAKAFGHPRLTAEAMFAKALVDKAALNGKGAANALYSAVESAARAGDDGMMARALIELLYVVGDIQGLHDEAVRLGRVATSMVHRAGDSPALRSRLHSNLGVALQLADRLAESEQHLRLALAEQRKHQNKRPYELFQTLSTLGNTLIYSGRLDEAEQLFLESGRVLEQIGSGSGHFRAALGNNLAVVHSYRGNRARAIEIWRRIAEDEQAAYGENTPKLVPPYLNLAIAYLYVGDYAEAAEYATRVVALRERGGEAFHVDVGWACVSWGEALVGLGEAEQAHMQLGRAESVFARALAGPNPHLAQIWTLRGDAFLLQGKLSEAKEAFDRALAIQDERNAAPGGRARAQFGLSRTLWRQGRRAAARAFADKAAADLKAAEFDLGVLAPAVSDWRARIADVTADQDR